MNISVALSLGVALVGVLMYLLLAHPKGSECGRLMFVVGLLAFLMQFTGRLALSATAG